MNRHANKLRFAVMLCLTALAVGSARAALPDSGWYWNPAEDGRGFNIEIQDNKIFMSGFAYKPDGTQAWYVGGGPMTTDRTWSGDLYETANGQPIGGAYRPPTLIPMGRASINFTSEKTAQVTLLGSTVNVQRQDWSGYGTTHPQALAGEWSTSEGNPSFPIYFSDRITLNTRYVDPSGVEYMAGSETGSTPSKNAALGRWDAGTGKFVIMVDSSTSYYTLYIFTMNGLNRAEGLTWIFKKNESPTGSGMYFLANRTKSGAKVRGYNAPGVAKDTPANDPVLAIDRDAINGIRASQPVAKSSVESDEAEGITRLVVDPVVVNQLAAELKMQMGR